MRNILALFILFAYNFTAAESGNFYLFDSLEKKPVSSAVVTLITPQDTLINISGDDGKVYFDTQFKGKLIIQHISFETKEYVFEEDPTELLQIPLQKKDRQLDEVIISGEGRATENSQSMNNIKVIDSKRIESQSAVNLRDVLSNELNIQLYYDGVTGSQIQMQGLDGEKVKILIDGVPVIGRVDGNIDLDQINLDNIERIEIIEGPMAIDYGTDAMAGTINLITKKKLKQEPTANINSLYESIGRYNLSAGFSVPVKSFNLGLNAGRNFFDGFDPNESSIRNLSWNPKEQYFGSFNLSWRNKNLLLRYNFEIFDEEIRDLGNVDSLNPIIQPRPGGGALAYPKAIDNYFFTRRLNNSIFADYFIGNGKNIQAYAAYNFYERKFLTYNKNLTTGSEVLLPGEDNQDTSFFDLINSRIIYNHSVIPDKLSYRTGIEISRESGGGERIDESLADVRDYAIFGSLEYNLRPSLKIKPGLRYAENNVFDPPLIKSLSLSYDFWGWKSILSYGESFRAPGLKERLFYFVDENHNILGNEDLRAESSRNYQYRIEKIYNSENFSVKSKTGFFANEIKDEIRLLAVIEPTDNNPTGLFTYQNIDESQTVGFNQAVGFEISNLSIDLGFNYLGIKNSLAAEQGQDNFLYFPEYRFNLSYLLEPVNMKFAFFMNRTGKRPDLIQSTDENGAEQIVITETEAFVMSDFTISKYLFKDRFTLTAGIRNLFNVVNLRSSRTSGASAHSAGSNTRLFSSGRSYILGLKMNL